MQVTDGKSTCARVENPSDCEVCFFFFNARVTSWLPARVVGIRQEGMNPCRMVPSMWDEVHSSYMTSRARSSMYGCACRAKMHEVRVAALEMRI